LLGVQLKVAFDAIPIVHWQLIIITSLLTHMKKPFKIILGVLGGAALLLLAFVTFISVRGIPKYEPKDPGLKVGLTTERIEHGRKLASVLCIECHADSKTRQLTGKFMDDIPADFGKVYSRNITQDMDAGIGRWTDGQIAYLLRTGVTADGEYIPPYMPKFNHMSDEDIASIIAFLRSDNHAVKASKVEAPKSEPSFLTKFLSTVAFHPMEYPAQVISTPDITNQVEYGKYLVNARLQCYACHSKDFKTNNEAEPEKSEGYLAGGNAMLNHQRQGIRTANITMDPETGIGNWTEEQFVKAIRGGHTPDGRALRYPMLPYSVLEEPEARAIYAYLKTVPPVKHKVNRELTKAGV
jgi:mono/diheme cytochrome c family protein